MTFVDDNLWNFAHFHDRFLSSPFLTHRLPGFAPKFSAFSVDYMSSPELGGANEEVYGQLLGRTPEELAAMKEGRVI